MNLLKSFVISVAFLGMTQTALAEKVRVGVVDVQKALQTVADGKKARGKLENTFNKKNKEVQAEEKKIREELEAFQKKAMVMSDKVKAKKQAELQQKYMKLQEKKSRYQAELQKTEAELTKPIIDNIRETIKRLAKEKGYTVVLEKNANNVLYSLEKDDLTQLVIKQYKKK